MIAAVTAHICGRFAGVKLEVGDRRQALKVYAPGPERAQGVTIFPCVAISRTKVMLAAANARPCCELVTPSDEQISVQLPPQLGGGLVSGPDHYTVRPYPTPITVLYQVDLRATVDVQAEALQRICLQALPPGYQPTIEGYAVTFQLLEIQDLDDLAKPQYWTAVRYWVHDIWVERFDSYQVPSITGVNLQRELGEDNGIENAD